MDNEQDQSLEVLPPSAIMAMEKAQIDMQIATAHQYPRSLELFKKRALAMACLDPETADSCIYLRPVGKENGKQKYAEGPSIRLAEIVAVSYGNLRAASKVVEQTERYVKCTGMAHDLESNTAMSADCIESTVTKDGQPYSERQRALIAKVCGAKAIRDAIFKCVPRALCKPIMEAAKKVASGKDRPLEERRKKAQAWAASLKVDPARILAALGVSEWSAVTDEELTILTGLKTAMADGDETIDSAFPPVEKKEAGNKPAPTAHQQATQGTTAPQGQATPPANVVPLNPEKKEAAATEPAKAETATNAPQSVPEKTAATQTPPQGATGQAPQEAAQATPPAAATTPAEAPPAAAPEPSNDPKLDFMQGDTDPVKSIKTQVRKAGGTFAQLRAYLVSKKLMRDNQNDLRELANARVDSINRHISGWLKDILAMPK